MRRISYFACWCYRPKPQEQRFHLRATHLSALIFRTAGVFDSPDFLRLNTEDIFIILFVQEHLPNLFLQFYIFGVVCLFLCPPLQAIP